MNRRGFLSSILACAAAPAIVPRATLIVPAVNHGLLFRASLTESIVPEYAASVWFRRDSDKAWQRASWKISSTDVGTLRLSTAQFPAGTTLSDLQVEQVWPR